MQYCCINYSMSLFTLIRPHAFKAPQLRYAGYTGNRRA